MDNIFVVGDIVVCAGKEVEGLKFGLFYEVVRVTPGDEVTYSLECTSSKEGSIFLEVEGGEHLALYERMDD